MSSELSAPEAGDDAQLTPILTFASLPRALQVEVFARMPADARARAACVCRAWRAELSEHSLWLRLNLSPECGVARTRVTDALLRGAAAKARGGLTALDVSECPQLTHAGLLEVVTANAGALTELRLVIRAPYVTREQLGALLGAAPLLRECHADVMEATPAVARRMLRNEAPFGPLCLHTLCVRRPWRDGEAGVHALTADVATSASPLSHLLLSNAPLSTLCALDAVVDAALARRLTTFGLCQSSLSAASVPGFARLLSGSALSALFLMNNNDVTLLQSGPDGSAALLAAALRANNTLRMLALGNANVWHDAAAAETLLQALTGHPSLHVLRLDGNAVRAADRARAGASLGALIAANAPLQHLDLSGWGLGDEGLGPLVDALGANTHLRELDCSRNDMSDAFAYERLQPAHEANTSLRKLTLVGGDDAGASSRTLRLLEQIVAMGAAVRDAMAAATAAGVAVAVQ
jgi:hypothetical protein